jgi:diguanylate cyclase (GGDEF)-like protein
VNAVRSGALMLVAGLICAGLLFGDPGGLGLLARLAAAGLSFFWAWRFARRAAIGPGEQESWHAFSRAAAWVGVALLARSLVEQLIGAGQLGPAWAGVGFGVVSLISWSYLFRGIIHWNPLRLDESDRGDWLNGLCGALAGIAVADLAIRATHTPMADWGARQETFWLGHCAALLILLGATVTVANLGGLAHDPRVIALATVLGLGLCLQVTLGFLDRPDLARTTILVVWVVVVAVVGACTHVVPATPRAPTTSTSASSVIGALVVIGVGVAVLALDGFVSDARAGTTLVAAIAVVGGGARVLQLVVSLGQLGQSQREARTDELTGLANRRALGATLATADADQRDAALLVVDLDRFKEINDHHGHSVGDEVLRTMADRLRATLPADALLGRLGGDEFAVLLLGAAAADAASLADAVMGVCTAPVDTTAGEISVGASVGVATTAVSGETGVDLMRRADTAMYVAKRGGGGIAMFDEDADREARRERDLLDELRWLFGPDASDADRDQILVHFQPQLSARTGDVVGVEALVRWRHPRLGVLFPDAFLDLVERHGLMFELTRTVLHHATRETRNWAAMGRWPRLAVNLSASSLTDPDLLPMVDREIAESGIDPSQLTLEITETTLMTDPEGALDVMRQLAARRIAISIDDYGTGYSSLAYLNDLPANELKLDRSFTSRVLHDQRTASIIAGTVDIAHGLGLRIIAEGVEDEATLVVLRKLGCDETQGYLHARPMPADYFLWWLAKFTPSPKASVDTRVAT